jgi:hypothetical protein
MLLPSDANAVQPTGDACARFYHRGDIGQGRAALPTRNCHTFRDIRTKIAATLCQSDSMALSC